MKNLLLFTLFVSAQAHGLVENVTLSSQETWPSPRWIYGVGTAPSLNAKDPASILASVRKAQIDADFAACASRARSARPNAKSLQAWLSVAELECAAKVKPVTPKSSEALARAVDTVASQPSWLLIGAPASRLKTAFGAGLIALIEQDLKSNRARAWKSIERIDEFANLFDEKTKAQAWKAAGQLSEAQAKLENARDFYKRALSVGSDAEIKQRLSAVERALGGGQPPTSSAPNAASGSNSSAFNANVGSAAAGSNATIDETPVLTDATTEERDLADRAAAAFKSGDIVVATDLASQLIQKFPGGARAKWATDRFNEALASFADKTDPKYSDVHDQVLERALRADGDRIAEWARLCYNRAQFADAFTLSKRALSIIDGARRTKALDIGSQAAIAVEDWSTARLWLTEINEKSSGLPTSRDALLRLGLVQSHAGQPNEAIVSFERLLADQPPESSELIAKYWLWRALQKTKSPRAASVASDLAAKFPFSYYGLRARIEQAGGKLDWKFGTSEKIESTLVLTAADKASWEKAQLLMKAGWLDEAQSELRELPAPVTANDKAVRSLIWAAAGGFVTASRLANEAWDEKSDLRKAPFVDVAFPREFTEFVNASAKKRGLDRNLVRGLIKQESSYNPRAISLSNAYGLMQMIPPTAREIAQDLKFPPLKLPDDLFVPKRNIEMGTYYLAKQITHYSGSVPLALASYNAGPGRIDRWLRTHPSARSATAATSSAATAATTPTPEDELWFDEIPYSETCFYVKAILRNVLLYRLLEEGRVEMPNPVWQQQTVQSLGQ